MPEGATAERECTLQLALLRREQGRTAEAELAARRLDGGDDEPPGEGSAVTAAVLADMGRDGQAWARLTAWHEAHLADDIDDVSIATLFAEVAAALGDAAVVRHLYDRLRPYWNTVAVSSSGAACHGSVSRHLGLLAHKLDRWTDAAEHFEAALEHHAALASPVLLAHTQRQYAALLRLKGARGDWERADELLSDAERSYRRLGVARLADQAQAVLARDEVTEPPPPLAPVLPPVNVFRQRGEAWNIAFGGTSAEVSEARGMQDLSQLLAHPSQSVHVGDLLWGSSLAPVGTAATGGGAPAWRMGAGQPGSLSATLDQQARSEHAARLDELETEIVGATKAGDAVGTALAAAEKDRIEGLIAAGGQPLELAREAVATRIRLAVEHVGGAHAQLGRHLRGHVKIATFCSYEPPSRTLWRT